ncbi:MAG: LytTR family DNA-binding domain-containing protein, partial [Bacteroidota bacterium]
MNALIIEDEQLAADRLSQLISKSNRDIQVIGQFDTVRDTVDYLQDNQAKIDILFCDIQLADGLSFNIFEKIKVDVPVVFTTAYDEYSLRAFKVNSVDYLLKPVRYEELEQALDKYQSIYSKQKFVLDPSALKSYFEPGNKFKERFLVKAGNKYYNKLVNDITYFSSEDKIVYLHDGGSSKKYIADFTLEELTKKHLDPHLFFRISRKFIVNINAIDVINPYLNQRL